MNNTINYNLSYSIEQVNNKWELTIFLLGLNSLEHTGYLNQESSVMSLACPEEQIDDITETFTPYKFDYLSQVSDVISLLESEKEDIIQTYLFENEMASIY